jgi:hypothetical protein
VQSTICKIVSLLVHLPVAPCIMVPQVSLSRNVPIMPLTQAQLLPPIDYFSPHMILIFCFHNSPLNIILPSLSSSSQ